MNPLLFFPKHLLNINMYKLNTVQNGKGSKPRPLTSRAKFLKNWDAIFSKKVDNDTKECDDQESYEKSTDSTRTEK